MKALLYASIGSAILFLSLDLFGQNNDSHKTFSTVICNYNLPLSLNGLSVTSFNVTPTIRIQRHEKNAEIFLDIKSSQGTSANPNPSFTYSYNFMGKKYGNESVGKDAFGPIQAGTLTYEVLVTYGSQSWGWKRVDGDDNSFGPIVRDANASGVMVNVRITGLYFSGTSTIENRILALTKAAGTVKPPANPLNSNAGNHSDQNSGTNNKSLIQNSNVGNTTNVNPATTSTSRPVQSGSALLSDKVKVNGAYVQVFQQNGTYYMVNADGTQHQTTKYAYDQVNAAAKSNNTNNNPTAATRPSDQAAQPALNNYNSAQAREEKHAAQAQVVGSLISGIGNLLLEGAQAREQESRRKQEAEDQAYLERQQAEEEAANERTRKVEMAADRSTLLNFYGNGSVPLSSKKIESNELYFFSYTTPFSLSEENPMIYVSGVFPVNRYGDGTWPFTNDVTSAISRANKGLTVVLSPYYTSKEEAEGNLSAFLKGCSENAFSVHTLIYKPKPTPSDSSSDFWGNPVKSEKESNSATTQQKNTNGASTDFWGNPVKSPANKPATKPAPTSKPAGNAKAKVDFWGNPIKNE